MERSLDSARDDRREGYGRDDGRDQGRDENQRILYFRGFRAIDGRDGGFLKKNENFQTSQRHLTTFSASPYEFLSVRYGDADTFLTTFQQFPPWEHFIPTVGTNALEPVLSSCPYLISCLNQSSNKGSEMYSPSSVCSMISRSIRAFLSFTKLERLPRSYWLVTSFFPKSSW